MSDSFSRRIKRDHMRAAVLVQARAHGCTCEPDIEIPASAGPGLLRVATVSHDNDCPHYRDPDEVGPLGHLRHQLAFDACRFQVVLEQQGGRSLAAWRIRRVYPQQRAEQGCRFLPQGGIAGLLHALTPR